MHNIFTSYKVASLTRQIDVPAVLLIAGTAGVQDYVHLSSVHGHAAPSVRWACIYIACYASLC